MKSWHARRTFSWGMLLLWDRDTSEVPELTDSAVSQSKYGLAISCGLLGTCRCSRLQSTPTAIAIDGQNLAAAVLTGHAHYPRRAA